MSYSQGDKIDAADYNNLLNGSNQLNTVWAVGTGDAGYGQTALSTVSQTGLITATQWATLINTLNSVRTHQSGSGSGISAVTAGATINWISTLQSSIDTSYTSRLSFNASGSTTVGANFATAFNNATTASSVSNTQGVRCAFASADAARYFFNAGGRLKFNFGAGSSNGSARSNAVVALANFMGGVATFGQTTNGGRTGTGGTLTTNNTGVGYWNTSYNTNTTIVAVTNTTANYTSDTGILRVAMTGAQGSNGSNGINVDFYGVLTSASGPNGPGGNFSFDDTIGLTVNRSIDIIFPSTTNLSNTWGTPTISAL